MRIKINVQAEAAPILREMAREAGVGVSDMAEIAVYNLIAVWQKDRGVGAQPFDAHDDLDITGEPV